MNHALKKLWNIFLAFDTVSVAVLLLPLYFCYVERVTNCAASALTTPESKIENEDLLRAA